MSGRGQMCGDEDGVPLQWRNHADKLEFGGTSRKARRGEWREWCVLVR